MQRLAQHTPTRARGAERGAHGRRLAAAELLQPGDILLAIDGKVVTQFREVERAAADKDDVEVTVWRGQRASRPLDVATASCPAAISTGWCSGRARRCRRRTAP